jgi:hypothetical protein
MYGEAVVSQLENHQYKGALLLAYASHFRVARATVSILMLESEQDYRRFKIDSQADFASYVKRHEASTVLAELPSKKIALPVLPKLPGNQLQEFQYVGSGLSVCKLPAKLFVSLSDPVLQRKRSIQRSTLNMAPGSLKISRIGMLKMKNKTRHTRELMQRSGSLEKSKHRLAALRVLSAVLDIPGQERAIHVEVGKRVYKLGFFNDAYFQLRNAGASGYTAEIINWLARTAKSMRYDELAMAYREFIRVHGKFY